MNDMEMPWTAKTLAVLTAIQALGAIGGGIGLVRDPVRNIGLPVSLLEGTPFHNYLIPGLILLIIVGLVPLVAFVSLIRRQKWAWWVALSGGIDLVIWIIVEVVLLGYLPGAGIGLQIVFGLLGVTIIVLALARPTRDYFQASFVAPRI
jgi:hypothetical protein